MTFAALNHVAVTVSGPWCHALIGADRVLDEHTEWSTRRPGRG